MIVCGHVLCSFIMIVCGDVLCSFHNVRRNVGGECGATSSPASANAPSARGRQAPAAFSASLSRSSRQYPGNDHPTEIRQMTFGFGGSLRRLSFSGKLGSFRRDNLQARSFMSAHDAVDGSLSLPRIISDRYRAVWLRQNPCVLYFGQLASTRGDLGNPLALDLHFPPAGCAQGQTQICQAFGRRLRWPSQLHSRIADLCDSGNHSPLRDSARQFCDVRSDAPGYPPIWPAHR